MSKFQDKLAELGFNTYEEYLQGSHWSTFRASYFQSSQPRECMVCGSDKVELHHITYQRLGAEILSDVVPLCRVHHEGVHQWLKKYKRFVSSTRKAINYLSRKDPRGILRRQKSAVRAARIERKRQKVEREYQDLAQKTGITRKQLYWRGRKGRVGAFCARLRELRQEPWAAGNPLFDGVGNLREKRHIKELIERCTEAHRQHLAYWASCKPIV